MKAIISTDCTRCAHAPVCNKMVEFMSDSSTICKEANLFDVSYPSICMSIYCEDFMFIPASCESRFEEAKKC